MQKTDKANQRGILTKVVSADQGTVHVPMLTPHLQFRDLGEQQMLLVSETFNTLLHGQLTVDLIPLLDGQHEIQQITQTLKRKYSEAQIQGAISTLSTKGYVVSGEYDMANARAAYWSSLGASPRAVEAALARSKVSIHGDEGHLEQLLREAGVSVTEKDAQLSVFICSDYLEDRFESENLRCIESRKKWILARPLGTQPLFGPVFRSDGSGPCWSCLSYRLRNHQEVHNFLRHHSGEDGAFTPFATEPVFLQAVYRLIAVEISKWLVFGTFAPLDSHVISLNNETLESSLHLVERRPQCQACGDDALYRPDRPATPIKLNSSPKSFLNSGGTRSVAPSITLAKYKHIVSPISGVVSWLSRTTEDSDPWLHVHWAGSNLANRSRSLSSLRRSLRSKSAGKGSTHEQSEVSALCEAVERYSGAYHGDEIREGSSYSELRKEDRAIHPNEVQLFSEDQFNNRQSINAKGHPYNIVPSRFDESAVLDWSPVWSFTQKRHRYLPTSMLYSMPPEQRNERDRIADSNGCAAGNTLEEAILQGFYELVERDAFAIWWYNRMQVPAIDLSHFDDEFINSAKDYYARYDREMWVLDVTLDFGIPAFVAISNRPNGETEDIIYGAGAHPDPHVAALRAICELNQCLTWLPRPGKLGGQPTIDDPVALWWWKTARVKECRWLVPVQASVANNSPHSILFESNDAREDVEFCRDLVAEQGMEFLVLDQTRPDIGLPVARVIVPGMRHFWARFAPGRLYEIPVSSGYLDLPLDEAELNNAPVIA